MDDMTPAEEYQLKLIYAAVFSVLGYIKTDVPQLQKTIHAGIRSMPFQVAIAGHGGSGSVKYGDRYPPLAKCISAFKSNIAKIDMEIVRGWWLWIGRQSHDHLLRRYTRQFGSTVKICSCIGFAIKWQHQHNGRLLLERGERYYIDVEPDPDFVRQLQIGKMMIIGIDKWSRPLVLVRTRLHNIKEQDREVMRRLDLLIAETCEVVTSKLNGCTVIYDLTKFTAKNRDQALLKFGMHNFTKIYPGMIGQFCLHNAPATYKANFKAVNSSVDPALKSKIKLTSSTDDLLEFVNLDQLPKELGGTSSIDSNGWTPPRKEDDARMADTETRDRLMAQRAQLLERLNEKLANWINGERFSDRNEMVAQTTSLYYELDPYVRSRTVWDRQGIVKLCRPELCDGQEETDNGSPNLFDADSIFQNDPDPLTLSPQQSLHDAQPVLADPCTVGQEDANRNLDGVFYGQDALLESLPILDPEAACRNFQDGINNDAKTHTQADFEHNTNAYYCQEPQTFYENTVPSYYGVPPPPLAQRAYGLPQHMGPSGPLLPASSAAGVPATYVPPPPATYVPLSSQSHGVYGYPKGRVGTAGASGASGASGPFEISGFSGLSGPSGAPGPSGPSGAPRHPGLSGPSRHPGLSGPSRHPRLSEPEPPRPPRPPPPQMRESTGHSERSRPLGVYEPQTHPHRDPAGVRSSNVATYQEMTGYNYGMPPVPYHYGERMPHYVRPHPAAHLLRSTVPNQVYDYMPQSAPTMANGNQHDLPTASTGAAPQTHPTEAYYSAPRGLAPQQYTYEMPFDNERQEYLAPGEYEATTQSYTNRDSQRPHR